MPLQNKSLLAIYTGMVFFIVMITVLSLYGSATKLGLNIPQTDMQSDYLIGYLWSIAIGLSILVWRISDGDKRALIIIWIVKSCITLGFMLFYESYYSFLDAYSYFNIPRQIDYQWSKFDFVSGTENVYNIIWLYYKIMPYSYHALKVSFAMIGLVAIYLFYRSAVIFLGKENIRLLYIISFFPSILFWSSIIGKDPIILLGMSLYVYGTVALYRFKLKRYICVVALGVMLAMSMRTWMGPILVVPLFTLFLREIDKIPTKILVGTLITGVLLVLLQLLKDRFAIGSFQDILATLDVWSRAWSEDGGSGQVINVDFTSIPKVLAFVPLGMFTALFRPLPGEVLNLFGLLAGLENAILIALFLLSVKRVSLNQLKDPVIFWLISLVFCWAVPYGFVSYQNLGTAVRFRLQILPVFLYLLLFLSRRRQPRPDVISVCIK
jgi:hypothetical protein